jgi:hypothetical protein
MIESVYVEGKIRIEFAIAIVVIIYEVVAYEMVSGHLTMRGSRVTRASDPIEFWIYIAFKFTAATALLLSSLR